MQYYETLRFQEINFIQKQNRKLVTRFNHDLLIILIEERKSRDHFDEIR